MNGEGALCLCHRRRRFIEFEQDRRRSAKIVVAALHLEAKRRVNAVGFPEAPEREARATRLEVKIGEYSRVAADSCWRWEARAMASPESRLRWRAADCPAHSTRWHAGPAHWPRRRGVRRRKGVGHRRGVGGRRRGFRGGSRASRDWRGRSLGRGDYRWHGRPRSGEEPRRALSKSPSSVCTRGMLDVARARPAASLFRRALAMAESNNTSAAWRWPSFQPAGPGR